MKQHANIVFTLLVAFFLVILMIGPFFQKTEEYSYYENRNLAQRPELQAETLLNGSWFSSLETYLSDHSVERENIMVLGTWLDLYAFHRPVVNSVVIGDDVMLSFENY